MKIRIMDVVRIAELRDPLGNTVRPQGPVNKIPLSLNHVVEEVEGKGYHVDDGDVTGTYVFYQGAWYKENDLNPTPKETAPEGRGYHIRDIKKQIFGTPEKIQEELEEFLDAREQKCRIMQLVELSDLVGAVEGILEKEFPGYSIEDLLTMSRITQRAFKNGKR